MTLGPLPRMTPKLIGGMRVDALLDSMGPTVTPETILRDVPEGIVVQDAKWLGADLSECGALRLGRRAELLAPRA